MPWFKVALIVGVACALFVQVYFDAYVPEPIKEKWTVKTIDAISKTCSHMVTLRSLLGYGGPFSEGSRKLIDRCVLLQVTGSPWGLGDDPGLKISNRVMDGVPVRLYEPVQSLIDKKRPVVVYFHGGGWSLLSVDSYDPLTRKLANDTGFVVISVEYRQAPQHPYPAAFQDCLKVLEYVLDTGPDMGIDPGRIAVAGDSAGGNLAAAVSLRLQERIRLQIILVPVLQVLSFNTTSWVENVDYLRKTNNDPNQVIFWLNYVGVNPNYLQDFLANRHTSTDLKNSKYAKMTNPDKLVPKYYIRTIKLRNTEERKDFGDEVLWNSLKDRLLDPHLAPLMADDSMLGRTAQAYVMTAGYDVVRDDGIMYSSRLKASGVKTVIRNFPDAFHMALFFHSGPLRVNVGTRIVKDITNFLKKHL